MSEAMTQQQVVDILRACLQDPALAVDPDDDLLASGSLDSLTFIDFIAAIEQRLGLQLPDDVVFGEKFNSLAQMADSILELKGGRRR